jgi:hypothetical protein
MNKFANTLASMVLFPASWMLLPAVGAASAPDAPAILPAPAAWSADAALKEKWGVEITSLRRTANGRMLDFRYKVLDADKAAALFVRKTKPNLIHQVSGKVLAVPNAGKVGPLRNSDAPKEGRIYWMFFGNAGNLVKAGDKVTVAIGDFRAADLVVE